MPVTDVSERSRSVKAALAASWEIDEAFDVEWLW